MLPVLIILAIGTIAGGWFARHRPLPNHVQVLCGLVAILGSILSAARSEGTSASEWWLGLAAVVAGILCIPFVHRWRQDLSRS
ncbi:MAG TPA: hypothetical protein VG871_19175 [Vicinamibacterales bacterium]|nr:hypothetical protein [Vicinamibacterales bacterium]